MKPRTVDPSALRITQDVAGAVLASPMRRFLAYAADWALIVPISMGLFLLLLTASLRRMPHDRVANTVVIRTARCGENTVTGSARPGAIRRGKAPRS
jgi:hypothetical protein